MHELYSPRIGLIPFRKNSSRSYGDTGRILLLPALRGIPEY